MATDAELDATYGGTAAPAAPPASDPDLDALYGDHPTFPVAMPPPASRTTAAPSSTAAVPTPQDGDGQFTRPVEADGNFLTRTWHSLKDSITGEGRYESDIPDLIGSTLAPDDLAQTTLGSRTRLGLGLATTSDPEGKARIIKSVFPDATFGADKFGNPTTTLPSGTRYYLNRPGLSAADVAEYGPEAIIGTLAGAGAGLIPAIAGRGIAALGVRMAAQGAAQGGASVGRDAISDWLGSGQGIDPARAAGAAAAGAVAEPIAAAVAAGGRLLGRAAVGVANVVKDAFGYGPNLIGKIDSSLAGTAPATADMLNATGRMVLTRAGVNPADLTIDQLRALNTTIGAAGRDLDPATVLHGLQSVRTGIPLTTGQLTGNLAQLGTEEGLSKGTAAPAAAKTMADFRTEQGAAVRQGATDLVPGARPPGTAAPTEAELGQALAQNLQAKVGQLQAATTAAYAPFDTGAPLTKVGMATSPSGRSLTFDSSVGADMLPELQQIARERAIYANTPAAQQAQTVIGRLISNPSAGATPGVEAAGVMNGPGNATLANQRPFNLGDLDTTMRQLNSLYDSAANDADRGAVNAMRRVVQSKVDDAALNGAISGDPDLIQEWQTAKGTAKTAFDFLSPDNPTVQRFIDRVRTGDLTGQEVINGLYGAGQLGAKDGTKAILDHLQTQFPQGSPEYQVLQQAAVRRMLFGTVENPAAMSPNNIANRITEALTGNGQEISTALLDQGTRDALGNFRDTMRTLQQSAPRNPSGTADRIGDMLRTMAGKIPIVGSAFNNERRALAQAQSATAGTLAPDAMRPTDVPIGLVRRVVIPTAAGVEGGRGDVSTSDIPPWAVRGAYGGARVAGGLLSHVNPF